MSFSVGSAPWQMGIQDCCLYQHVAVHPALQASLIMLTLAELVVRSPFPKQDERKGHPQAVNNVVR